MPGDMNTPVLEPNSVDLLLVDHTMAFNVALREAAALDLPETDKLYQSTVASVSADG